MKCRDTSDFIKPEGTRNRVKIIKINKRAMVLAAKSGMERSQTFQGKWSQKRVALCLSTVY